MKHFLLASFLFACVSTILVFIWFHSGLLIAFGESEIPFYNPANVVHFYAQPWSPTSLGFFPGTTLSAVPFFLFATFLSHFFPGFIVEAIYFFFFSILGMFGGYFLVSTFIEKDKSKSFLFALFGGFFYTLNFIALLIAYSRLQYPFTIFYLGIPFSLIFFILGIQTRQWRYVIYFNLTVLFFAAGFGGLPFMEIMWYFLGSFVLFTFITHFRKHKWMFSFVFIACCFLLWIIMNMWWLSSSVFFALFLPHPAYSVKGNIGTLDILSDWQGNLSYLFRLMNQHYLQSMIPTWGTIFFSPIFIVISYLIPVLVFLPILLRKIPYMLYYFLGLALIALFFTKGSVGPFGEIFSFLFSHLFFLQVFRNPFEKIGILLPAAFVPLMSYSLLVIFTWLSKKRKKLAYGVVGLVAVLLCGVLAFPFWNGWVFTYNQAPANNPKIGQHVEVPRYYDLANEYINTDTSDTRILALPMSGEGITTNWPHPYNGVEYTNGLFGKSAISYSTIMPYLENVATQMNYTFVKEPQAISRIMQLLNAKYLMLRSDVDYKARLMPNPKVFVDIASKNVLQGLVYEKTFGQLQFYKTIENPQKIYVANNLTAVPEIVRFADVFAQVPFSLGDTILSTGETSAMDAFARAHSSVELFQPSAVINYATYPSVSLDNAETMVAGYFRFLPGSRFYFLQILKEKIGRLFTLDSEDKMFYDMDILSRRFGELQTVVLKRDKKGIAVATPETKHMIDFMSHAANSLYKTDIQNNINNFRLRMLGNEVIVNNLLATVSDKDIQENLQKVKKSLQILELQTSVKSQYSANYAIDDKKRIVYQFILPEAAYYDFTIKEENFSSYYENVNGPWDVYVNNQLFHISPVSINGWFDFGQLDLQKGLNEIHIFIPMAKNLIHEDTTNPVKLIANKDIPQQKVSFPVLPFDAFAPYRVSYDYRLNMSGGPIIEAENEFNAPRAEDGKIYPQWSNQLSATFKQHDIVWGSSSDVAYPFTTANTQTISFITLPVNTCVQDNQYNSLNQQKCTTSPTFIKKFLHPVTLEVKNVKVERIFSNTALLKSTKNSPTPLSVKPEITFKRINSSQYNVSIKHATQPFILVFSETYYNDWQATYTDTKKAINSQNHILANHFANAWYITRTGNYNMTLEFTDARLFEIGKAISIPVIIMCLGVVIFIYVKRTK